MKQVNWAEPDMGEEEANAAKEAVLSNFIGGNGPYVKEFEKAFAKRLSVKHAIAICNGTMALICAMQALRLRVSRMSFLVPTLTFFATGATAFEMGNISYADVDRHTWNMIPDLTDWHGTIILPVDLCGLPADYDKFTGCKRKILADSAEAIGSKYKGTCIGSQANIHTFSLHSSKVITSGEGGMITTQDDNLAKEIQSLANQGYTPHEDWWAYTHSKLGFNYRMSNVHAAIGLVQLRKLDRYLKERKEKAMIYKDVLGKLGEFQEIPSNRTPNYFLLPILVKEPIKLCKELKMDGINTKCIWTPLHLQGPTYLKKSFPNAEYIARHGIFLPIGNTLTDEDTKVIADIVKRRLK